MALKITEMLLSECDPQRLQLIANSYLDMLHVMLESPHTDMQIMATNSVSSFILNTRYVAPASPAHTHHTHILTHHTHILTHHTHTLHTAPAHTQTPHTHSHTAPSHIHTPHSHCSQFVVFAEQEEDGTPYHRQYDFLIHRFAAMSLVPKKRDSQTFHE